MAERNKTLWQFGRNIARIRSTAGISQEKLAEMANIDRTYICGIECGRRNPGIKNVIAIARALGVSLDSLFPVFKP